MIGCSDRNVGQIIAKAYPATMELTVAALIVALGLAIPAGMRSALRRNRWDDRVLRSERGTNHRQGVSRNDGADRRRAYRRAGPGYPRRHAFRVAPQSLG